MKEYKTSNLLLPLLVCFCIGSTIFTQKRLYKEQQSIRYTSAISTKPTIILNNNNNNANVNKKKTRNNIEMASITAAEEYFSQKKFGHRDICPRTISILNLDALDSAYTKVESFHNGGGSLKSVETLLNAAIDDTYRKYGVKFTPKGSNSPLPSDASISSAVKTSLVSNDVHKRGGYDQRRTPGTFEIDNKLKHLLNGGRHVMDVIEPWDGKRWEYGLGPVTGNICKTIDIIKSKQGKRSYDDKFVCSYDQLLKNDTEIKNIDTSTTDVTIQTKNNQLPKSEGLQHDVNHHDKELKQQGCDIISIGSNGQWGFEEEIARATNCITHTFDCTVSENPRKPNIDSIHFYPYCVSNRNEVIDGREYATYFKMIEKAGMTQPPSLFKMDVEGFEYDVMAQMLDEAEKNGTMDMLPTQISIELHYATRMYDVPWMIRGMTTAEIAMFVGMMFRKGGYMIVHHEPMSPGCHSCAEILFVRTLC